MFYWSVLLITSYSTVSLCSAEVFLLLLLLLLSQQQQELLQCNSYRSITYSWLWHRQILKYKRKEIISDHFSLFAKFKFILSFSYWKFTIVEFIYFIVFFCLLSLSLSLSLSHSLTNSFFSWSLRQTPFLCGKYTHTHTHSLSLHHTHLSHAHTLKIMLQIV